MLFDVKRKHKIYICVIFSVQQQAENQEEESDDGKKESHKNEHPLFIRV